MRLEFRCGAVDRAKIFIIVLLPAFSMAASAQMNEEEGAYTSVTIPQLLEPINLDGDLYDWTNVAPLELSSEKLVRGAKWGGAEDLSARVWLAWDEGALYFAVDMRDDDYFGCRQGAHPWVGDSFMFSLRFPAAENSEKIYYLILSERSGRPIGSGLTGEAGRFTSHPFPSLRLASFSRSGLPPILEGCVEWADMLGSGCDPPSRLEINLEARDLDGSDRIKSLSWVPSGGNGNEDQEFGLAILLSRKQLRGMMRFRDIDEVEFVELVYVPVVVADHYNNYVMDLDIPDFQVFEDGVEQKVDGIRFETRPVTIGLLIDSSGSMERHIEHAKRAAIRFLESLRSEDRCYVIAFNHNIELLKDLEGDTSEAISAIESISAKGGTLLYASLHFALRKLNFLREKKVLVLLSDGKDESAGYNPFGEELNFDIVLEEAKRQEVAVYAVAYRLTDNKALTELTTLVKETGGRMFTPSSADQLYASYDSIAQELKSQYLLTYVSNNRNWDGRWRKIEVRVKGKNYKVRSRPGYYAPLR